MPSVADAVKALIAETDEPPALVAQVGRNLRENDLLPESVGRRVAQVDERDVAMLLLGVYTATKLSDASQRAMEYASLTWGGEPNGLKFGEFLTRAIKDIAARPDRRVTIIDDAALPFDELRIEIVTSYPLVGVSSVPTIGRPSFEGTIQFAGSPRDARRWRSSKPRRSVTIPGYALANIVSRLFGFTMPPDAELYDRVDPAEDGEPPSPTQDRN
jgi:hypothetical protein